MPQYTYRCPVDNEVLKTVASYTDTMACPKCGHDMERDFPTRTMVVFGQGGSLADCHDIEIARMEANGELDL